MYEGYKDTLSPEFVESVPPGDGIEFKAPVEADPDLSEGFKKKHYLDLKNKQHKI